MINGHVFFLEFSKNFEFGRLVEWIWSDLRQPNGDMVAEFVVVGGG